MGNKKSSLEKHAKLFESNQLFTLEENRNDDDGGDDNNDNGEYIPEIIIKDEKDENINCFLKNDHDAKRKKEKIEDLKQDIDQTKGILLDNIKGMLERNGKIEDISNKSRELEVYGEDVWKKSNGLAKKKRCEYFKLSIWCWILGVLLFLMILGGGGSLFSWFMGWL